MNAMQSVVLCASVASMVLVCCGVRNDQARSARVSEKETAQSEVDGHQADEETRSALRRVGLPPKYMKLVERRSYESVRACFESGIRRESSLRGGIRLTYRVESDGRVSSVSSAGSDLPDEAVIGCVAGVYSALSYPRRDDQPVVVARVFELDDGFLSVPGITACSRGVVGGVPLKVDDEVDSDQSEDRTDDAPLVSRISPEAIQGIVRRNYGRFRACYKSGLQNNPRLKGCVAVRFVIDVDGSVSSVRDSDSSLPDVAVVDCVMNAYRGLQFPKPTGGIVTVAYPVFFSSGE